MRRDLPPLNALRAFEAAARLESVSRAADELHVTHGAVSRQIRTLEDAAGQALFVRQGRGLALTAAGRELQAVANDLFERLRDGWQQLQRRRHDAPLVLGCPGSLLARWMIPRMGRLQHDLPNLKLHLSAQDSAFTPALSGLDAALMLAAPPWPQDWQTFPLARERIGPVLSPRYGGPWKNLSDLRNEALLHTTSRPQAWPEWAAAVGIDPHSLQLGQAFDHLYYLLEAAVAGLGVAIAPEQLVADDLTSGRLIAPWGFVQTDGWWLLAAPARAADPRIAALAGWLSAQLAR